MQQNAYFNVLLYNKVIHLLIHCMQIQRLLQIQVEDKLKNTVLPTVPIATR